MRLPVQPRRLFHIAKRIFRMPPLAVGRYNLGGQPLRVIREKNRFAPMGIAPCHTRIVIHRKGELRLLRGFSHRGADPILQLGAGLSQRVGHPLSRASD